MLTMLHQVSLGVIVATALWAVLDPRVRTGIVGSMCLGGVAVFSLAACEGDPPNWLVGQTGSIAGVCAWFAGRTIVSRSRLMRRLMSL